MNITRTIAHNAETVDVDHLGASTGRGGIG
jgi:hypothetical protein